MITLLRYRGNNKVSIIIPTIKTEREIANLISEIKNTVAYDLNLIIVSGNRSTAKNRNIGLERAKNEFIIMCDDDVEGFLYGWDRKLIDALKHTKASMVGARLLNPDGTLQETNYKNFDLSEDFVEVKTMITACCAFRNTALRFDESYMGSGYEDTDFCRQLEGKFFVANRIKIIHRNESKNMFNKRNRKYFREKWA